MIGTSSLFLSLALQVSARVFFHELSHIVLRPNPAGNHSTFGFSLAYQQNGTSASLVTGAPHSGHTGQVFKCPFSDVLTKQSEQCNDVDINFDKIAPYKPGSTKLNLGVSISATPDYFFTCAPLWRDDEELNLGTCFVYDETAHRYNGILEQFRSRDLELGSYDTIAGGTGWRTFIDQRNHLLMISKVALKGDMVVLNSTKPLAPVWSFVEDKPENNKYFFNYDNIGTSMTAGNFFDKTETLYAINSFDRDPIRYTIHFLRAERTKRIVKLSVYEYRRNNEMKNLKISLNSVTAIGSMFGAAMHGADLNNDGFSELLVGAPAQADGQGGYESGALHIYLGGDPELINDISKHSVITSSKIGSRFGAAITSNDVDGDGFPEIFVSAPYEDYGGVGSGGVLYILSGFEVNKELIGRSETIKKTSLSQLKYTQRIKNSNFQTFGYSLQILSDLDGNGCDELAVGSPGTNNIMLLRCVPAIKVDVSIDNDKEIVKEEDDSFTRKVCAFVKHLKQKPFSASLNVSTSVIGVKAQIEPKDLSFTFEVNETTIQPLCRNITVFLRDHEPHVYTLHAKVGMDEETIIGTKNFNSAWVTISQTSQLEKTVDISRHCVDKDCEPKLSMTINWSGQNDTYTLGSSDLLKVSLVVKNEGNNALDSCVRAKVTGAPIAQFPCATDNDENKCMMPKPLKKGVTYQIDIKLNMSQPTNLDKSINVEARLFEYCDKGNFTTVPFKLKLVLTTEDILLTGLSHSQNVSDTAIQEVGFVNDAHEYLINNNASVYWKGISAVISIQKRPYIDLYRVNHCSRNDTLTHVLFSCIFELPPRSNVKIIASTRIVKSKIMANLVNNQLNISSELFLHLNPTSEIRNQSVTSSITLQKEQSLAQNKGLIIFLAVLGAAIALAVLAYIMYKMGFFKREEKTKLDDLKREHIRRQSVKRSMSTSHDRGSGEGIHDVDLEVDDDSPFDIIDTKHPILKEDR